MPYAGKNVSVKDHWNEIKDTILKKIFFSQDMCHYFEISGGKDSKDLKLILNLTKHDSVTLWRSNDMFY